MRRLLEHLKELATEGAAISLIVLGFLVIFSRLANSGLAAKASTVPVVGTGVKAFQAMTNQVVTPVTDL